MTLIQERCPKIHKVRFIEQKDKAKVIARYEKQHEVTVGEHTASQMTTWTNDIVLDRLDIEFLMRSEA